MVPPGFSQLAEFGQTPQQLELENLQSKKWKIVRAVSVKEWSHCVEEEAGAGFRSRPRVPETMLSLDCADVRPSASAWKICGAEEQPRP